MVVKCYNCVFRNDWDECANHPDCNLRYDVSECTCHKTEQEMEELLGVE